MQFNETKYTEVLQLKKISVKFSPTITKNTLKNDYRPILWAMHIPLELF